MLRLIEYTNSIYCVILILGYFKLCTNFCPFKACFTLAWDCVCGMGVCVGGISFTHKPIYASKRAHLDGPITPVVMDSSTELGSFLMMTSDWGLSQSSGIFFIAVVGYVLYWLMPCPFTGPKMFCAGPNFLRQPKNLTASMPCPFTGRKMFCAGPNFLCQTKNLFTYCACHKHFVPYKKMICIQ